MVVMRSGMFPESKVKIETRNLNVWFGPLHAVKNISIAIPENRITAIIGPSGCGKSTFIRALNRLNDIIPIARTTGEVFYDGRNIYDDNIDLADLRRKIGMVFQKPNPFPKSIYDNVAYGPRLQGVRGEELDRIVEESLKKAALWDEVCDRLEKSAMGLSGGQQQRLCIARALAVQPEVLLLDEPCSALDPVATAKIEDLMVKLKKDYTLVIVTHNMQQAARISDYTAFFLMGELIEYDKTPKIFRVPSDKRTEDYITGRFG